VSAETITHVALGFVAAWVCLVVLHALWEAGKPSWDPAPPEEPHPHHDH